MCSVTIRYKTKDKLYRFFVVPGGNTALLGMQDSEILGILSVQCSTIEPRWHMWEIN